MSNFVDQLNDAQRDLFNLDCDEFTNVASAAELRGAVKAAAELRDTVRILHDELFFVLKDWEEHPPSGVSDETLNMGE